MNYTASGDAAKPVTRPGMPFSRLQSRQDKRVEMNTAQWIERVAADLDAAGLYFGHGTDNARDEATWLVLHALGAELDGSFRDWHRPLSPEEEAGVRSRLAARIGSRQPLAYVLGSAWFAGLEFEVNPGVLVPRSPMAEMIREHFSPWVDAAQLARVLDLCTGCGCIAIAVAVHLPWVSVDATDISAAALQVAQCNINKHNVGSRVELFQSDLFAALSGRRYDLVLSNPPYVARRALRDLPAEFRAEPELGLVSGDDGLDACLEILLRSPAYMTEKALLVCEVGESEQRLQECLPQVPFMWLEFSSGGSGVFMLSRNELLESAKIIRQVIEERKHVA